jgi:hypothetical protein
MGKPWLQRKQYVCPGCGISYLHDAAHRHACHECPERLAVKQQAGTQTDGSRVLSAAPAVRRWTNKRASTTDQRLVKPVVMACLFMEYNHLRGV